MKNLLNKIQPRRFVLFLSLCLVLTVFCDLFAFKNAEKVYDSVIRLHVLAASDSEQDQAIKLLVRDRLLEESDFLFQGAETLESAKENAPTAGEKAVEIANSVLAEQGVDYTAHFEWGTENYPTREYDGISFPVGNYYSLRLVLGDGEGQNWWCVLFPPLCTSAATAKQGLTSVGLDTKAQKVFTSPARKYVFRFKLLELLFS